MVEMKGNKKNYKKRRKIQNALNWVETESCPRLWIETLVMKVMHMPRKWSQ